MNKRSIDKILANYGKVITWAMKAGLMGKRKL